ncbi:MAG: LCP family protein [Clostridiales bacterium]|nr:LCP family protein [Clostridiales bacterium]
MRKRKSSDQESDLQSNYQTGQEYEDWLENDPGSYTGEESYSGDQDAYSNENQHYGNRYYGSQEDGSQYYGQSGNDAYNDQYYGSQSYGSWGGGVSGGQHYGGQYYGQPGNGASSDPYYGGKYYGQPENSQQGPSYYGPQGNYYSQQDNFQRDYGQDVYGAPAPENGGDRKEKRKKQKKKKKKRKIFWVLGILVLLVAVVGIAGLGVLGKLDRERLTDILVNSGVTSSGYRNIAIFGVDSREGELESGTRSDTIIIASINKKTGDIKLVSIYRDTYLDNTDGSYRKATEAYAYGGASQAVNMLNKNLDLDIEDYVTVDFEAVIEVVDELGGVEVTLDDEEVYWLNAYLVETSEVTGRSYTEVTSSGTQTLTGIQAMAYCRIRYTTGWDYKRTERQRTVITQILKRAQEQGVTGLLAIVNNLIPYISTSLDNTELLSLATGISKYEIVDSQGFPFTSTTANLSAGDCVVAQTLSSNVAELHELLFGTTDYTPSSTVQEISNYIVSVTGIS